MFAAQRLYENGYITYMRTDSTALSEGAVAASRAQIAELYGDEYLSGKPRTYANKVKNAQEAHEAIRPAGDEFKHPDKVTPNVGSDEAKVYELIWKRTLASQMADARGESVSVKIDATSQSGRPAEFTTSGRVLHFPGFLAVYTIVSDDAEADKEEGERALPPVTDGDDVTVSSAEANGHETKPPARYTEASLVRKLEELGIGRPSTYASIIETIQYRGYVWKRASALVPSVMAFATVRMLEDHFTHLVDYAFTAGMEEDLDRIANGEEDRVPWLEKFFRGNGQLGLLDLVSPERLEEIDPAEINSIPVGETDDGVPILARVGKFGPYLKRGEDTASLPEDLPLDQLTVERANEILDAPSGDKILGTDPESGLTVLAKHGRFGPYVQLGEIEEGSKVKPKTASLFSTMTVDEMGLDTALKLLTLPRVVGIHPETEEEITAQNGRYGPYLRMGKDSRTIDSEEQLLTVTVEEAVEIYKQPKRRHGQAAPQAPLKEIGKDPVSDGEVVLKEGRFGLYVTDGVVNASLQKQDTIENIELDRAAYLLQARRDRMAAKGQWPPKKK
jgi:DNA topoisomerase-1